MVAGFLAKLSGGDVVVQELKYHWCCFTGLYHRETAYLTSIEKKNPWGSREKEVYPCACSELLAYIVETQTGSESPPIFRLADLYVICMVNLDRQWLEQLLNQTQEKAAGRTPWARSSQARKRYPSCLPQRCRPLPVINFWLLWRNYPDQSSQDLTTPHDGPQIQILWNLPWRMCWRSHSIDSYSVRWLSFRHGWAWDWDLVHQRQT